MLLLISQVNNPAYNLATEEYLLHSSKYSAPIVFLWQNENTIVIGRNQNTLAEINLQPVLADEVNVVRRNTGGGAVFQDLGNICFSLIIDRTTLSSTEVFKNCLEPIIALLQKHGLNAQFRGRNDLEIDGYKISGNAQLFTPTRILAHGTLLFDVDLKRLEKYLHVNPLKMNSKKVKSVRARVANIKDFWPEPIKLEAFIKLLKTTYLQSYDAQPFALDQEDEKEIQKLITDKYNTWLWNYGKNETFDFVHENYWPNLGLIQLALTTKEGKINKIKFSGDFLGEKDPEILEQKLLGKFFRPEEIETLLEDKELQQIFGSEMDSQKMLSLFFV